MPRSRSEYLLGISDVLMSKQRIALSVHRSFWLYHGFHMLMRLERTQSRAWLHRSQQVSNEQWADPIERRRSRVCADEICAWRLAQGPAQRSGGARGRLRRRGLSAAPGGLRPSRACSAGCDRTVRRPPGQMQARAPEECARGPRLAAQPPRRRPIVCRRSYWRCS